MLARGELAAGKLTDEMGRIVTKDGNHGYHLGRPKLMARCVWGKQSLSSMVAIKLSMPNGC